MKYDRSIITMILHWHSSLVPSLGNCVDDTDTHTSLIIRSNQALMTRQGRALEVRI